MNMMSIKITLVTMALSMVVGIGAGAADLGLTVKDGKLYKDGRVYRAAGVNYCDLFEELLGNPESTRTLEGLKFLGEKGIPFVRFWAGSFGPKGWDLYLNDKEAHFKLLDKVARTAEESHVGLIPSVFWCDTTPPAVAGEHRDQLANPDSKTWEFMRGYIKDIVTRYKDSTAIWAWECGNEWNLAFDLPNGMEFVAKKNPGAGYNLEPDNRDLMTAALGEKAFRLFAEEVRKYDPTRAITSGNANPRSSAYHLAHSPSEPWKMDTREHALQMLVQSNPDPMNMISIHSYPGPEGVEEFAGAKGTPVDTLIVLRDFAREMKKPLFLGEYGGYDYHSEISDEQFRANIKMYLDAILKLDIDLSAYWVFDYTKDRTGMGLARKDNEYAWILDAIVKCNDDIQAKLK